MKKIIIALVFVIGSFISHAQEEQVWYTNIDKAISVSKKENKPLFLFFTGSDWCGWCIRLQKEVFKTPEFTAWAKDNVVLVDLDFPRKNLQTDEIKKQNMELQQFFAVAGYPTVWFTKAGIDASGKTSFEKLGSQGYAAGGPPVWLANANAIISKFVKYSKEDMKNLKTHQKKIEKALLKSVKDGKKDALKASK